MVTLITERLTLRPFVSSDAFALETIFMDVDVMRYSDGVKSKQEIIEWVMDLIENQYPKNVGFLAMIRTADQVFLGYCGLTMISLEDGRPVIELGYRLAHKFWGQGYATEAARSMLDHATNVLRIDRIVSLIDPSNDHSIRVAKKIGMRPRAEIMMPGYDHPDILFSIEKTDGV